MLYKYLSYEEIMAMVSQRNTFNVAWLSSPFELITSVAFGRWLRKEIRAQAIEGYYSGRG